MASKGGDDGRSTEKDDSDKVSVGQNNVNIVAQDEETSNVSSSTTQLLQNESIDGNATHSMLTTATQANTSEVVRKSASFNEDVTTSHTSEFVKSVQGVPASKEYREYLSIRNKSLHQENTHDSGDDKSKSPSSLTNVLDKQSGVNAVACEQPFFPQTTNSASAPIVYFNSSGVADEDSGEKYKLEKSRERRYLENMIHCYKKGLNTWWKNHRDKAKVHKVIAALICDQEHKKPYTAILTTGTHYNDQQMCRSDGTCDGHAESVVYELIPKYFMREMLKAKDGDSDSVFEFVSADIGFKLRSDITFHLMVTEPPCGFITTQTKPCFEWKPRFYKLPHIPTCSSRILIGDNMGIQGYVSHLLVEPVYIKTVIICCEEQLISRLKFNVDTQFKYLTFKTIVYDPSELKDFNFLPMRMLDDDTKKVPGDKECAIAMVGATKDEGLLFCTLDAVTGADSSKKYHGLSIRIEDIYPALKFNERVEAQRKENFKKKYNNLANTLNLEKQAEKMYEDLTKTIRTYQDKMSSLIGEVTNDLMKLKETFRGIKISNDLNKNIQNLNTIKGWESDINDFKKRKIWIEDAKANKELIMDCFWNQYFLSTSIPIADE